MPSQRQPCNSDGSAVLYQSIACLIGTHHACSESSPASAPVDIPVIYEACDCPCHSMPDHCTHGNEVANGSASGGLPASDSGSNERKTQ